MLPQLASIELCSGCTACKAVCPKNAISMVPDKDGFLYPQVNEALCVGCHLCEKTCPVLHPGAPDINPKTYAAYTKDRELRLASSSGGLFTELAKPILAAGGVVFGCVWEKPAFVAIHAKAETLEELAEMRGSKYVQSDVRDTYREAKAELLKGRQVLYSGTPCQIAGLNAFLGKSYDNLLTVQIICHSTPSPAVFEKFKLEERQKYGKLKNLYFRDKSVPSKSLRYDIDGNATIFLNLGNSSYGRAFFNRIASRLSCYNCQAKQGRSGADITIGDFWGIEKVLPDIDRTEGVSILAVHSIRGKYIIEKLNSQCIFYVVDHAKAFSANPYYSRSTSLSPLRKRFLRSCHNEASLDHVVARFLAVPLLKRILLKIKSLLGKIKRKYLHV